MNRHAPSKITAVASGLALAVVLVVLDAAPAAAEQDSQPAPPSNLRVDDVQPDELTVSWDPVEGASEYKIAVIPLEPGGGYTRTETDGEAMTLDGLSSDVPYKVTVRAFVPDAYPNWYTETSTVTATTPLPEGYDSPTAPPNLRVERDAQGEVELIRWDAATGSDGPLLYQLRLDTPAIPWISGVWARTGGLTVDADNLPISGGIFDSGDTVTLSVTAVDRVGKHSPASDPVVLTCCAL